MLFSPKYPKMPAEFGQRVTMDGLTEGIYIIIGSLSVALFGMAVARQKISREMLLANHEVAGYMLSIIGTLYAVLLGLVVVNVQSKFEQAKMMAVTEANCLSDLYHLAVVFDQPNRDIIHDSIHDYAIAARNQDWAAVSLGQAKEATIPSYRRLWKGINTLTLKSNKQEANYSAVLTEMSQLADSRRFRMVASCQRLSPILWVVLVVGELLIVWFTYFFVVDNVNLQTT
ncbi:MAG TPA: hypothetical protein V6C72_07325, partial [Chroococcales cyanobacterium]